MSEAAETTTTQPDFFGPVRALGLERYVAELDNDGYTVVPPEKVGSAEFVERVTDAVLRVIEERTGATHSLDANGAADAWGWDKDSPKFLSRVRYLEEIAGAAQ